MLQFCAVAICATMLWGCWSSPSPQQRFANALMRGNSMQASQIWLHMSPEDRVKFSRGEGVTPGDAYKQQVKQALLNHYQHKGLGPSNAEEMDKQVQTPLGASLENLSKQSEQSSQPPSGSQSN